MTPASIFRGRRNTLETGGVEKSQNALARGRQLCTQLSIFERSLAELLRFLILPTSKIEDSLEELASFLTLSRSKIEEVLQK